ncbi:hypothetical protein B566_EDAN010536 [Ephemera danica]|nr:hypothetical protein B566_EDAN010536 [Ephemera danica]
MLQFAALEKHVRIFPWKKFISYRSLSNQVLASLREGNEVEGFEVTQVCSVPELHLSPVIRLEHKNTGAQYLHLARADDTNNAFAIAFRTSPRDSTGLPHILEHVTLCGSKRFPVRDPFFKMLNRSLASFMNAMTGPDYTVYPFSTPNERDYKHLLSVYLDAVFRPLLRDLDFSQEGWRLEHEIVGDSNSPLVLRGVVFNEMKGAFADPQQRLHQDLLSALLPGDTYAHVFGGEPICIPALTADDLRRFQAQCYHPSNARMVSYGHLPLDATLRHLQQDHLAHFSRQKSLVMSELLLGGPTSALHRALIEPGFGDGFASCTGFEPHTRDTFFAVGLQGVSAAQYEQVCEATRAALEGVRNKGFETEHVEAILHRLELGARAQSASFGLDLALALLPSWNHGADPVEALNAGALVLRLRSHLKQDPKYLQSLVDQHLCSNQHVLTITMSPSEKYEIQQADAEQQLLTEKVATLDAAQREDVLRQGLVLQQEQMKPTDVSCLPTLSMADLTAEPEPYETLDTSVAKGVPVQICAQPTNGVTHFRALLDTSRIDPKLRSDYLPLFLAVATKMGTAKHDYKQFDRKIQLSTSGLGLCSHIIENPDSTGLFMDSVLLSSVCLDRNVPKMLELWHELLSFPSFNDKDRLETLIKATAAETSNGIAHSGHRYAMLNSSSRLTLASQRREQLSGLQFISKIKEFSSAGKEQMNEILENLQQVANILYTSDIRCAVNITPEGNEIKDALNSTFSQMSNAGFTSLFIENSSTQSAGTVSSQHHVLPLPVGYLGRSIATGVPYTHPDHAALRVSAQMLSARYLHPEVRERGGAYGSGATMNPSGTFSLFSYRDPEASRATGRVFDKAAAWLMNSSNYEMEHIEEAKLSVFQRVDAPTAPGDRGMTKFLQTVDRDMLQKHRLFLRNVSRDDVLRVAAKYLDTSANPHPVASTLIGPTSSDLDSTWEVLSG